MNKKELENLLGLTDKDLARFANRYKGYKPTITILQARKGKFKFREEPAPDWAKGFLDGWSSPKNCGRLIKDILGKGTQFFAKDIFTHYANGGEHYHVITPEGKKFSEYLNVYDFQAFVPLIRKLINFKLKERNRKRDKDKVT